jgi:ribosomal protein S18 acetylase RimI-like enzyme
MTTQYISSLDDSVIEAYMNLMNAIIGKVHSLGLTKKVTFAETKDFLKTKITQPKSVLLFLYEENDLVGTGCISPSGYETAKHYCEISKVMVDPTLHGKGYGKQIMKSLEEKAKELGYTHILLDSWDSNFSFYEKCGYEKVGKIPDFVLSQGKYHDLYYFAKKIK